MMVNTRDKQMNSGFASLRGGMLGMWAMVLLLMLGMVSCKPSLPRDILSKGKMTDILYDYHIALAMAQVDGDNAKSIAYKEAVLRKHDVTSAEFDSSMVYYMRHTELLHDVYKDLGDRMNNAQVALGGSASGAGDFGNLSATGDTANIWKLSQSMVFCTFKPFNSASFEIAVDTTFHKGDRLMLDFDAQFLYQDGMRDGVALLAVQFQNDSVAQQVVHVQSSMHYSVQVSDDQNLGIKSVKGYFMLSDGGFSSDMGSQTTLKLMFLEHIKLIRMHQKKMEQPKDTASGDSLKTDSMSRNPQPSTASPAGLHPTLPGEGQPVSDKPIPVKPVPNGPLKMTPPGKPVRNNKLQQAQLKPIKAELK